MLVSVRRAFDHGPRHPIFCYSTPSYVMASEAQLMETTKDTQFGANNTNTGYYQVQSYKAENDKVKSILLQKGTT